MRDLSSGMVDAIVERATLPVIFYEGEFDGGTTRLCTAFRQITWNSQTWTGAGSLASISVIEETSGLDARGIQVGLSGIPSEIVALALGECRLGLRGKIWFGLLTDADEVIADPALAFDGVLDVPTMEDAGETASITISYESRLIDLNRPREWRRTHEAQRKFDSADRFYEYVSSLVEWNGIWGAPGGFVPVSASR